MLPATARYREYSPCDALRSRVRAIFTFSVGPQSLHDLSTAPQRKHDWETTRDSGDPLWSNLLADAHASLVCCIGGSYAIADLWCPSTPRSHMIGPMSQSHKTVPTAALVQVGAYFTPGGVANFLEAPACELAGKVVALESLWGAGAIRLDEQMNESGDDSARITALETMLLQRLASSRQRQVGLDLAGLTTFASQSHGVSVAQMADLAGVSRQYLSRIFQSQIGVTPKLFCRLTRFRALLAASSNVKPVWAELAAVMGYADQSHMIAEFRRFSGATPADLIQSNTFHPFRWS